MNLVIVESPAKCGKIQGFLGAGFKVIASMGHIRHLKEDLDSVGLDRDFEPTFEFMMKDKSQTIQQLKSAGASAGTVYLAADDDREGELIAYSVCLLLKLNPATTPRAVFHEITETAVKQAIQNPRRLDMNKVRAAEARAMLDMMIGFTMSPLLWKTVGLLWKTVGPSLSAGRCQTAALRLVCEREDQIDSFESSDSWKIQGQWTNKKFSWDASLSDELEDMDSANTYLDIHHEEPNGKIIKAVTTQWSEKPPLPLITSTLQQQASSLFFSPPKKTMNTAQRLYEAGHITYMRTDKAVLSQEAALAAQEYVTTTFGKEYIGEQQKPLKKTVAKANQQQDVKAQEAHEAIRPTHLELATLPSTEDWSAIDRRIYGLIWCRTVQSVMAPVRGDQRTITIVADGDDAEDFTWRKSWRRTTFEGWRRIVLKEKSEEEQEKEQDAEESDWLLATSLKEGQIVQWTSMTASPHTTKAKQHYNEANLIHELETQGIGRPSTFASLISTILDRAYVETKSFPSREHIVTHLTIQPMSWPPEETEHTSQVGGEKNRLAPTALGKSVLQFLLQHFEDLFRYNFTAQMETQLDKIAEGQEPWKKVLKDTWNMYKERYTELKTLPGTSNDRRRVFEECIGVIGKKGPLLLKESEDGDKDKTVFYGWPSGIGFQDITQEQVTEFIQEAKQLNQGIELGEHEGFPVLRKQGKFGHYASWNGKTISCTAEDTLETIVEKFGKQASLKTVGMFEIRSGPYGLYMFKTGVAKRAFVGVPKHVNLDTVTEEELIPIFQAGLKQKATGSAYSGGRGGRGGSGGARGGFRGRGRGGFRGRGQ